MRGRALGRVRAGLLAGGLCLVSSSVWAQAIDDAGGADYPAPPTEERGGFMFGIGYGVGYAQIAGYPNKLTEIGQPEFRQEIGSLGITSSIWIGGALRDWITFGIGLTSAQTPSEDPLGAVGGIGVRVEGYPMWALGGMGRNVALFGEFGAGGGAVTPKNDRENLLADGGSMSFVGFGAFWEAFKVWHLALGPSVQYSHAFSESMHSNAVTVGLRTALYWNRPKTPPAKPAAPAATPEPQAASVESALVRW